MLRHVTVDALLVKAGSFLTVRRAKNLTVEPGKLVLPGGYLDRDESADQAVLRELKEETGYIGKIISLLAIIHSPRHLGDDRQNVGFLYQVEIGKQVSRPDDEVQELVWVSLNDESAISGLGFDHAEFIKLYQQNNKFPVIR